MENKKFELSSKQESFPKTGERKILVVEGDLSDLRLSPRDLGLILEELNQLYREGRVETIDEARKMVPLLDVKELMQKKEKKWKPPRHTKKKGQKY